MATLTQYDFHTVNDAQIEQALDADGYVILTNVLSELELHALHNELEPHFNNRPNSKALFFGFNTKRIEGLLTKSSVVQGMVTNPKLLHAIDHVLGANCDSFLLNLTQGIRINPGEKAQILHPDSAMFPIENKPFEFMMNAIWAYSDFTAENGATRIVPGSHKWNKDRQPQDHEILSAEMPAGSVLIYAASLLHGGGANVSTTPRTGIAISYCLGWLRQSENQYLSYPPAIAKNFSEQLQRLIGYNVHRPNLGWVNGHDPITLITGENKNALGAEDFLTDEQKQLLTNYHEDQSAALTSHNYKAA